MTTTLARRVTVTAAALATAASALLGTAAAAQAAPLHYTGTLLSPTGEPVPNVFVSDYADDSNSGYTDANGHFDLVNAEGFTTHLYLCARLAQDAPQGGAAGWFDACAYVDPGVDGTIRFQPGAAIGGTAIDVRSGRPLAGASVSVWDNNDSYGYSVTTDARGHWTYRNLRPGPYNLVPYSANKVTASAPHGYLPVGAAPAPIALRAGQARTDLSISVAPAVQYAGKVLDGTGAAIAGAKVAVATYDAFETVATDASGTWTVQRPWSGIADVCTWAGATTAHPTGLAVTCRTVSATGNNVAANLRLTATGGALAGAVQVPDGGTPTVSVPVPVASGAVLSLPATKSGATYTVAGLPRGSFQVRASIHTPHGDAVAFSKARAVSPGATTTFPTFAVHTG